MLHPAKPGQLLQRKERPLCMCIRQNCNMARSAFACMYFLQPAQRENGKATHAFQQC
jgi:hypothetical protein